MPSKDFKDKEEGGLACPSRLERPSAWRRAERAKLPGNSGAIT
jgi:hypothetical protein